MALEKEAEEAACLYASFLDKAVNDDGFKNNFFQDWKKEMSEDEKIHIQEFKKCDFTELQKHLNSIKVKKVTDKRNSFQFKNKVPCPTLFVSSNTNNTINNGKIRKRITPELVTINYSLDGIQSSAKYINNVNNETIYINLNKREDEKQKFDNARTLKDYLNSIRENYKNDWKSIVIDDKQRGLALYFIDILLLRAGFEEPDRDDPTYGCCSLLVTHVKLLGKNSIKLKFKSKQHYPYEKTFDIDAIAYEALAWIIKYRSEDETKLFYKISPEDLNTHLKDMTKGLITTKVFRTYHATLIFEINANSTTFLQTNADKVYNTALELAAKECYHISKYGTRKYYLDPRVILAWFVIIITNKFTTITKTIKFFLGALGIKFL